MLRNDIENAMIAWIKARTGMAQGQVFIADQDMPAPKSGKYITLRLGETDRIGRDQVGPTDDEGVRQVIGNREIIANLNGYRKGAREALDDLADSLDEEGPRSSLRTLGVVVWDIGNVINVTVATESTMQPHYALEIFLRVGAERTEEIGYIAQVELEATTKSVGTADRVENVTIGNPPE